MESSKVIEKGLAILLIRGQTLKEVGMGQILKQCGRQ